MRFGPRSLLGFLALITCLTAACRSATAATGSAHTSHVSIIVPEPGDLKLVAFWTALGAGFFADEGFDLQVVSPDNPALAERMFVTGGAPLAILPGSSYERLIAARIPFVLAANLLSNDPYDLVIRRDFATRAHFSRGASVRRRLDALQGITIGVSPAARARFSLLFRTQGLDANSVQVVSLRPEEQLEALRLGHVDALYTKTPYLERALLDQDVVMGVDQGAGEVPAFSERMLEALAVSSAYGSEPGRLAGLARAIAKAERLLHNDAAAAEAAIFRALPKTDRRLLSYLLTLYAPAVPPTPHVEARLVAREASFGPAGESARLTEGELGAYVFDDGGPGGPETPRPGVGSSPQNAPSPRRMVLVAAALVLFLALVVVGLDEREHGGGVG